MPPVYFDFSGLAYHFEVLSSIVALGFKAGGRLYLLFLNMFEVLKGVDRDIITRRQRIVLNKHYVMTE